MSSKFFRLLCLLTVIYSTQSSASSIDIGHSHCSGTATFEILNTTIIDCTGNLSINGNALTSEVSILINARGDLSLENVYLRSPLISLFSENGRISLGENVLIESDQGTIGIAQLGTVFNAETEQSAMLTISGSNIISLNSGEVSQIIPSEQGLRPIDITSNDLELTPVPLPTGLFLFLSGLMPVMVLRAKNSMCA